MRRIVSFMFLSLLLVAMLSWAFNVGPVHAQAETVYINNDGSVSPSSAPISSVDNVTYTFTGTMSYPTYNGVIVKRSNIVINGNGYAVQGNNSAIVSGVTGYYELTGLNLTNTSNVTINNANIQGFYYGIYLNDSNNNVINGNNATSNGDGIDIFYSSNNNTVTLNNVTANSGDGIYLYSSSSNTVSGNTATANIFGIQLDGSSNNTVSGNNVTANDYGIWFSSSSGNVLSGNVIENSEYNFYVSGSVLSDFMNYVDTSNLVNGKPIYYMTSESNLVMNPENYPNVGYLAVVNCTNMTVQNLTLANDVQGILLAFTNDSKITNNNVTNHEEGIVLDSSSDNNVIGNNVTANIQNGIHLESSSHNTVSGNTANGYCGIYLDSSSDNVVNENNATANSVGIFLHASSSNLMTANKIENNVIGLQLTSSTNNTTFHNDFIGNLAQVAVYFPASINSMNTWDDGYPSGGNYWSNYNGTDFYSGPYQNVTGSDGIGDTPYLIDANNTDRYPLMGVFSDFNVTPQYDIQTVSNSTISNFQCNGTAISFNVAGENGTVGFCRISFPTGLTSKANCTVYINGTAVQFTLLPQSNSTYSYSYSSFALSTQGVTLVPELPSYLILVLFIIATSLTATVYKKKAIPHKKL